MSELAERLEALASRNAGPQTDEEIKERYLELLAEGNMPPEAAKACGRTGRHMRGFRSEKSSRYDPDFALRYEEIMAPGGEFETAIGEIAEHALVQAAQSGNVRAIEKVLMAYHARYQFLRPVNFQGEVNIENFIQLMPGVPTELLQQMREALLAERRKELPVIDAA